MDNNIVINIVDNNITIEFKNKIYSIKKDKLFYVFKILDEAGSNNKDNKELNSITNEAIIKKLYKYKLIDEIFLESMSLI